jgi:hypothetical protein
MTVLEKIACLITPTRLGRWAMEADADLSLLKTRPVVRTYVGIFMIMMSFVVGIPGVVVCGFLARKFHEPLVLVVGGSAAMVLNYSRWCVRKFIVRFNG